MPQSLLNYFNYVSSVPESALKGIVKTMKTNNLRSPSPRANYTDRETTACCRS
jgi:hypothetical protein